MNERQTDIWYEAQAASPLRAPAPGKKVILTEETD